MSSRGTIKPLTSLTPEQTRACEVTTASLVLIDHLMVPQVPQQLMRSDYKAFSRDRISRESLYHQSSWIWNQSSGKRMIQLTPDVVITGCKYNARLKPSCAGQVLPKYKAWIFEVARGILPPVWFLWCEKGYEGPAIQQSYRPVGQAFSWAPHSEAASTASRLFSVQAPSSHSVQPASFYLAQQEGGAAAFTYRPDRIAGAVAADAAVTRANSTGGMGMELDGSNAHYRNKTNSNRSQREAIIFPNAPQFTTPLSSLKRHLSASMPPDLLTTSYGHETLEEFNVEQIDALMSEWVENL